MYIKSLKAKNYRSLKDVKMDNIGKVCFLYGQNNTGKSNILALIDVILAPKTTVDQVLSAGGGERTEQTTSFHQGTLSDFEHNFYEGCGDAITFSISLNFEKSELVEYKTMIENLVPSSGNKTSRLKLSDDHEKILTIEGTITKLDNKTAEFKTTTMVFNTRYVVYEGTEKVPEFAPSLSTVKIEDRVEFFKSLCRKISSSFLLIGADRFVVKEILNLGPTTPDLKAKKLKTKLFELSTNKEKYPQFRQVESYFSTDPFTFGKISFSLDNISNELEIMLERNDSVRLPLERVGSGLQQILYLATQLAVNKNRILGIEELEINLSPEVQKQVSEMLKNLVITKKEISQVFVTSHSPYFGFRGDVSSFTVTYNEQKFHSVVEKANVKSFKRRFEIS